MSAIRYSCQILMELEFCRQSFEKTSNTNYQKIRPVGDVVRCGRTERHTDRRKDGQTNMTKALVAFPN